jgi:hypothetical protein
MPIAPCRMAAQGLQIIIVPIRDRDATGFFAHPFAVPDACGRLQNRALIQPAT